jgi:hypothetical protein
LLGRIICTIGSLVEKTFEGKPQIAYLQKGKYLKNIRAAVIHLLGFHTGYMYQIWLECAPLHDRWATSPPCRHSQTRSVRTYIYSVLVRPFFASTLSTTANAYQIGVKHTVAACHIA